VDVEHSNALRRIVIVGGGTAGWMAAALLATVLGRRIGITLVESEQIGTVGVGEATIPMIRLFNATLGLDEDEFVRETNGSFKLGIEFRDWVEPGHSYMHAFGPVGGPDLGLVHFWHHWVRERLAGRAGPLGDYVFNSVAGYAGRFMRPLPNTGDSPLGRIPYAFHFDAALYAKYLRRKAEALGVERVEGRIVDVPLRAADGFVEAVVLDGGRRIDGDLFLDCSGFRGLLIEDAVHAGYDDWSAHLPCNRAVAVPCASASPLTPYTRATARAAGWQWRIPLQHRTGNGYVFNSEAISEDEAIATLLANLDGEALAEPRPLRFVTGIRREPWKRNVVSLGLASGFLEPLESTSIHFIQSALARLLAHFPDAGFDAATTAKYNALTRFEYERCRDFLVLHYRANRRIGQPFWDALRHAEPPPALAEKIALFESHGRIHREADELFTETGWLQVMVGQGLMPRRPHPLADLHGAPSMAPMLEDVRRVLAAAAQAMPTHEAFLGRHCRAPDAVAVPFPAVSGASA
jgi:tryptophan halogenase